MRSPGITSERLLLPQDIVEAHKEGIIHFHDSDYYAQHMHNCDLVNLRICCKTAPSSPGP